MPQLRQNLVVIRETAGRIGHIVSQLRSFSRKEATRLSAVALVPVIEASTQLLRTSLHKSSIEVALSGFEPDMVVLGEETRLQQVFVNLIRNAIEAGEGLCTQRVDLVARQDCGTGCVIIDVRDYGPGLSAEALAHLFEPFYTSKASSAGLGLGLSLSQSIIRGFGGEIIGVTAMVPGLCSR